MRKVVATIICIALMLTFVSCNGSEGTHENSSSVSSLESSVSESSVVESSLFSSETVSSKAISEKASTASSIKASSSKASSKAASSKASTAVSIVPKTKFEQFEDGMKAAGFNLTNKNTMWAQMCGAIEGYSYDLDNGSIEIYRYDINSDAYKDVVKNKSLFVEGVGSFPVDLINDNMVLTIDNYSNKQKIIDIFKDLK